MALSYVEYPSSGSTKAFDLTFGYLSRTHVFAFVNDTLAAFTWVSPTRIELVNIPPANATIKIARLTDRVTRITTFADGQTLLSGDLNAGDLQNFYILQEIADGVADGVVAGTIAIQNPGTGYITEQWIQQQLQAAVGGSTALAGLNALIDQEVTARNAAILAEQQARAAALAAEANARIAVANDLAAALVTEANARVAVANDLAAEALARAQGDAAEAAARAVVAQNLATETNARTQAIASEAAARAAALQAEATARANALQAEATARADSVLALTNADVGLGQRLTTVESDVNTPTTGLKAKVATLTTTTTDLATNKADASVVTAIDAKIEAPTTGLKARATSLESRTTAVETGKASVASVSAIDAKIETPTTGLLARATSLEGRVSTVETGKASTSVTDALSAEINTPTTGLKARATSLETRTTAVETGKASTSVTDGLSAEINTPTTGLKARATSLESRVTTVETGKASASDLSALTSRVTTAEADIDAVEAVNVTQGNRLTTAESGITTLNTTTANLATNKADASTVTTLSATVTTVSGVANSKAKTFRQTAAPTAGMQDGDLWIDSDDGNKLYMRVSGAWTAVDDARVATTAANLVTESSARVSADNAQVTRLNSLEATVNTPTTGLSARVASSETAITDLTTNKASVSSVSAVDAKIETPTTGLKARATSLESRVSTVETGKASTSVTDTLSAEIDTPTTGLKARATSLESRVSTVETGKASTSVTDAIDAKIEAPTTGLKARATSLESRVTTVESGKAATTVTDAIDAKIEAPTTGLKARATSLESRVTTVESGKAATTVTDAIDAKIETPTTGLKARATSLETRMTTVETGKAATTVTDAIDAKIETPTTGLKARATSLETRVTSVETGKAATTVTDAIDAKIEAPTTGLKARATSLESRTTAVETNKADASTVTTLSSTVNNIPAGADVGLDGSFRFGGTFWNNDGSGANITAITRTIQERTSGLRVSSTAANVAATGTTADWVRTRGVTPNSVKVTPGDIVGARVFAGGSNVTNITLRVVFRDAAGGFILNFDTNKATGILQGDGEKSTFSEMTAAGTAPANAVSAHLELLWRPGTAGAFTGRFCEPAIGRISSLTSAPPRFTQSYDAAAARLVTAESNITTLQTTTSNLNTGKAEASTVTALTSRVSNVAGGVGTVSDFAADGLHWATNFGGSPGTIADAANGATYVNVAGVGRCMEISTYPFYLTPKAAFKPVVGRRYRITVRFGAGTDATGGNLNVAINNVNGLTELWAHGVPNSVAYAVPGVPASATVTVAEGFKTISREWVVTSLGTYDAAWRLRIDVTRSAGSGGTVRIADFRVEDVTDVLAATARGAAAEGSGLVKNSLFQVPFSGTQIPPDWNSFANGTGTQVDRLSGTGKAYRLTSTAGLQSGNQQEIPNGALRPGRYTIRVKAARIAGNLDGAAAYIVFRNAANTDLLAFSFPLATTKNAAGETTTVPDGITTWELPVTAPANTARGVIYFMNHFSPAGSIAVGNTIDWYEVNLFPATDADTRVAAAEANITTLQSTTVDLQNNKASATELTSLKASVTPRIGQVTGSLLVNPAFSDYPVASGSIPPGWQDWANGGPPSSRGTGKIGLYAHVRDGNANADSGIYQQRPITPGKYVMKCAIDRLSGTLTSAGVYIQFFNVGGTLIGDKAFAFELTPDTRGGVGVSVGYDYRQFERPFTVPANTTTVNVFLMNHFSGGFGSNGVYNQIAWHQLDVVSADYGTAEVDILKSALATENASEARVLIKVNTGTNVASFEGLAQAGDGVWNGSAINLTADKIKLQGDVIVTGTLTANEVQSNSLTKSAADVKTASQSVTTSYADVQSITLNVPTGASLVKLDWAMRIDGRSLNSSPCQTIVRVLRDGVDITGDITMAALEGVTTFDLFNNGVRSATDYVQVEYVINGSFAAFALDVGASAGNRVYTLQVKKDTAGATYTVRRSTLFGVGHAR